MIHASFELAKFVKAGILELSSLKMGLKKACVKPSKKDSKGVLAHQHCTDFVPLDHRTVSEVFPPETRKPRNARLSKVVGPHGLEPWTKGL